MTEIMKMKASNMTRGDYLSNFFMRVSRSFMPKNVPMKQNPPTHAPYVMSSIPFRIYVIVEAPVAKMIIYIPDALATFGGSPILSSRGLKIAPPPSPRAPETHPPMKENMSSFLRLLPFISMSQEANPGPYFTFIIYSYWTVLKL